MELKVCKKCRRLFKYIYGPELCQDCNKLQEQEKQGLKEQKTSGEPGLQNTQNTTISTGNQSPQNTSNGKTLVSAARHSSKDDEEIFEQVRDYIMANPKASVAQISEENDIPPTKLFEWIKDDRLEFSYDSEYAWFNCEKCGTKIKSGRICNRCKTK